MSSVEKIIEGEVSLNGSLEFYNFVWEMKGWRSREQIKESPTFKDVDENEWKIRTETFTEKYFGPTISQYGIDIHVILLQLGNPSEPLTGYAEVQILPNTDIATPPGSTAQFNAGKVSTFHSPGIISSTTASFRPPSRPGNRVFCQFVMKKSSKSLKKTSLGFRNLLSDQSFADVTIISNEDNKLPAHKAILAARSRVFKAMLSAGMSEATTNEIYLRDYPEAVVVGLLEYIYTDTTTVKSDYCEWLRIADMYELDGLKSLVETQLSQKLTSENAVSIFHVASVSRAHILKKNVSNFIKGNAKKIAETSAIGEFAVLNPEMMPELFKLVAGSE